MAHRTSGSRCFCRYKKEKLVTASDFEPESGKKKVCLEPQTTWSLLLTPSKKGHDPNLNFGESDQPFLKGQKETLGASRCCASSCGLNSVPGPGCYSFRPIHSMGEIELSCGEAPADLMRPEKHIQASGLKRCPFAWPPSSSAHGKFQWCDVV